MTTTDDRTPLERWLGTTEPVRRALYPIVVAVVALLVAYGLLDAQLVPLWLALAVAVLGIGGTEAARHVAYAPATVHEHDARWQAALADEYGRGLADGHAHDQHDEPGEHAVDGAQPATTLTRAPSRSTRCRETEDGRRCRLLRDHEGPHHMTTG